MLDDMVLRLARENLEYRRYVDLMPQPESGELGAVLYVELLETDAEALASMVANVRAVAGSAPIEVHERPEAMARALKLRQAGEPLLHAMPGKRKPLGFVEDNAVPVENLGEFVRRFRGICESHGTSAAFYAHASVGVLHVRPLLDLKSASDRDAAVAIAVEVADLAKSLGGVMSGEHGDGRARGPLLERYFGPELLKAFREVKAIFDPEGLLNPGNIVEPREPASIVETTRVRPQSHDAVVPEIETYFEFRDQEGFGHAIERCNGAGVCRKTSGGTMCPSYLATMDERHSTRGRGNALRLAVTGQFDDAGKPSWNDAETKDTLGLCLSCKACKAECPSNVDVSRLKAEYTAQGFDLAGGPPLAAKAFGSIRTLNRLGAIAPGLANAVNRFGPVRAVLSRLLSISHERSLPEFSRALPRVWNTREQTDDARPAVLLFGDCFSMYNESSIGVAAGKLLEAFGYKPVLIDAGCCGRAMISTGLLPRAIQAMERSVARLLTALDDKNAQAVLVLEPSCLSAMTDDWLDLRSDVPLADRMRISERAFLVEDFLAREWDTHPVHPSFRRNRPSRSNRFRARGRAHFPARCARAKPTTR
ncbi:MAG: FAD-linked oxidase C-terminal domain-containing protein, partial [Planctomycetota bacterium]